MSAPIYGHFLSVDEHGHFQVTEPRGGGPIHLGAVIPGPARHCAAATTTPPPATPPPRPGISVKVTDSRQQTTYLWCDSTNEQFWREFSDGTSKYKIGLGPASSCEIRCEELGTGKSKYSHLGVGAVMVRVSIRIEHLGTQPINGVPSASRLVQHNSLPARPECISTCECGALKAGCAAGMAGHSPWCPARAT